MVYDGSAEKDIRGIDIDKLVKGFGVINNTFKNLVMLSKTSARELRWYRKGLTLATAMNKLDTPVTQTVTKSMMGNTAFKAQPFVVEMKWERQTSYIKKYFVESPWISLEDIKASDPDVMGQNVRELVEAVGFKVDRRIYDVLTGATTSGTPNPAAASIPTTVAVDGWATTATCNPILDLLIGQRKISAGGYNAKELTTLMSPLEYQSLVNFLISVKGSSIPAVSSDLVKSGVIMSLLGNNIVVSNNATADWVIQWVKNRACTFKSFIGLTTAIKTEEGIGKKIRVWEEGEAILTDPLAVHVISSAS